MGLYSASPPAWPFSDTKPTLLTSWWITVFCALIIVVRLLGRWIRVERLFREDKLAAAALIPLFMRMAFVHPVLLYGTNNVLITESTPLSKLEIQHRSTASRLVLCSRILHPAILWLLKATTLEFFDRLVGLANNNRPTKHLRILRILLLTTFLTIIIADLAECHPFPHYWQVLPDPGGQCRQGYAQLLTQTVCNVATDLLLMLFPIPVVLHSRLSRGRKALLLALFCLHVLTAVVAVYKVPRIVAENGYQPTRTMWASVEVLVATFGGNALAIGTFVRDTGVKKRKAKYEPHVELAVSGGRRGMRVRRGI